VVFHQIFRVGETMAVDGQRESSFFDPRGMLPWQPVFVVVHGCRVLIRQMVAYMIHRSDMLNAGGQWCSRAG